MLEMSRITPTPGAHTLHIVNPRGVPFNTLIGSAASSLGVPLVPYPEWLSRLTEEHKAQSYSAENLEKAQGGNPALRLFGFFQAARIGPEWEPLSVARLDTARAVRVSNVLAHGVRPLGEENVRKWLRAWRSSGFLPSERKQALTVSRLEKSALRMSTLETVTAGLATSLPADMLDGSTLLNGAAVVFMASKFGFLMVFFGSLRLLYAHF
jgi:hypothetical protein